MDLIPNHQLEAWFQEDGLYQNAHYLRILSKEDVRCRLLIKSDLLLAGTPFFAQCFSFLDSNLKNKFNVLLAAEGEKFSVNNDYPSFEFILPFKIALSAERLALNLLQRASAVATLTDQYIAKAKKYNIQILDTRKTTPGLRSIEKYASRLAGACNHRFSQTDVWMIKDNHKKILGGLPGAVDFFQKQQTFYIPLVVEIHSLEELEEAIQLDLKHIMLDNFSPEEINEAIKIKRPQMTYEVSGGIRLETLDNYLLEGVDAISVGSLTNDPPRVDLSFKMDKDR